MKIRLLRRAALPMLTLTLALACGGDAPAPDTPADDPNVNADTALLGARMVEVARFELSPIRRQPWRDATRVPARLVLAPTATQKLGAIAEGRVTRVHVLPGDAVRRGQVLVRIHSHEMMDARARLLQAKAAERQVEAEVRLVTAAADRAERLFAARALSQAELERARTTRTDVEARLDAARAETARATAMQEHLVGDGPLPADYDEHEVLIRAPLDGLVISRDVQEGMVVTVGLPLVTVSRTTELWMVAHVPETAAAVARTGTTIRFTVPALGDRSFDAKVMRVAPAVDTLTRTVEVQAVVLSKDAALRPEQFATAELASTPGAPVLVVPAAAVQSIDGDTVVIAADQRGEGLKLEAVRVRTGRRTSEWVELLAGADTTRPVVVGGAAIAKAEILKRRGG